MRPLQLGHFTLAFLILLSLQNTIILISRGGTVSEFILYAGAFLVLAILFLVAERLMGSDYAHGCLFTIAGLLIDVFGGIGNTSAVMLYCLAIFLFRSKKSALIILSIAVLGFFGRAYLAGFPIGQLMNEINFRAYLGVAYYLKWHQRKTELRHVKGLNESDIELIELMADGYSPKEAAAMVSDPMTEKAAHHRVARARDRMGLRSTYQLFFNLGKIAYIRGKD